MKEIIRNLGLTNRQVINILIGKGSRKPKILSRYLSDSEEKFAIVSDTHLCSVHELLDELHTFYAICEKVGVRTVFHAGDILEGSGRIYRNQLNEIKVYGAMKQSDYVVENYPKVKGIKTCFITGNHCLSFFNENGIDVGKLISSKRKDMVYLGQYNAETKIGKARVRLVHAEGGGAYALSYKPQKFAEQILPGRKPDILVFGHWHSSIYFFYRNIHIFQAGTFQSQTDYQLRKALSPAIGGWICQIKEGKNRDRVVAMESCFVPFFI